MAARDIIDQGTVSPAERGFGVLLEESLQPFGRAAGVQCVPYRLLADPKHHRRSRRFDGGHGGEFVGQFPCRGQAPRR